MAPALLFLAGTLFTSCSPPPPLPPRKEPPNIVLISIDMLRPDHLGCYGYARPTSPRLDELAAEGALFENAVSSSSWTLPAHAALFTGLADSVHGCTDTDKVLHDSRMTLAESLRQSGYGTAGFFSGPFLHPVFGLDQGFEQYVDCTSYPELSDTLARTRGTVTGKPIWDASHRDVTNPQIYAKVRTWLDTDSNSPFFLFVHMWDVHYDFIPPPPYDSMFDPNYTGSISGEDFQFNRSINAKMPQRDLEHLIALYDGEITWTDFHVGRILDHLDALGLRDSTLVIVVADHGTEFFEHGRKAHRHTLYDEAIRIPMILRWPGEIEAGQRIAAQVHITDIFPTVTDLAGLGAPEGIMGRSLVPLLRRQGVERTGFAVSELFTAKPPHQLRAFRQSHLKLIHDLERDTRVVFDLREDPGEHEPLLNAEDPRVLWASAGAEEALRCLEASREVLPAGDGTAEIPPRVLERLRSLGYVGSEEE